MQNVSSQGVDGEYSENTLALFHLTGARVSASLTWKTVAQISQSKRLETERRSATIDFKWRRISLSPSDASRFNPKCV